MTPYCEVAARELLCEACLGSCKMNWSPHLPARIFKVHVEVSSGFHQVFPPGGLNNTLLSQGCVLEISSSCGNSGPKAYFTDRGGGEALLVVWLHQGHIFSMTFSTSFILTFFYSFFFFLSEWKSLSCVWLCNPMDHRVDGILQARILEWVAFPFTRGSSQPKNRT